MKSDKKILNAVLLCALGLVSLAGMHRFYVGKIGTGMPVQQTVLLQRLIHKESGQEFDLSLLKEFVYIETLDLSGPRLVIKFDDQHSLIRNYMGVKPGDTLTVTVADIQHRDQLN